ncbi:DUF3617 domain-containing protein [Massilia sp. DWR3-1-1]|uniref:DUF3617 domain-containing protein n=1 Tax=Massilia sp. DWR3-1-1 TaxID=2804559 RepID=UPI003CF5B317
MKPVSILIMSLASACAALPCLPAGAAEPLFKPGLWEIRNKPSGAGGSQMQAMLAAAQQQMGSMDPGQRKQIEAMMARNGVVMDNGGISAKVCITAAMAARQQFPVQQKGNCNYRYTPVGSNSLDYSFSCSKPVASGEGSAIFSSPTSYTATTRASGGPGGEHSMTIATEGRWLGAACGAIAPADQAGQ